MKFFGQYIIYTIILLAVVSCDADDKKYLRDIYMTDFSSAMAIGDVQSIGIEYYPKNTNCGIPAGGVQWTVSDTTILKAEPVGEKEVKVTALNVGTASLSAHLGGFSTDVLITVDNEIVLSDDVFMKYCLNHFDKNKDGVLQGTEVSNIVGLDLSDLQHESGTSPVVIDGLGMFSKLKSLRASHLTIAKIDLSENVLLNDLDISESDLPSLDLKKNVNLTFLDCRACGSLVKIDFGTKDDGDYLLNSIDCSNCALTDIDLSRCTRLEYLDCSNNRLKNLDLTNNLLITQLSCFGNELTSVKVSPEYVDTILVRFEADEGVGLSR